MTNRERILAIIEKRKADRIPWIPRLQIWYKAHKSAGTLPDEYREMVKDYMKQIIAHAQEQKRLKEKSKKAFSSDKKAAPVRLRQVPECLYQSGIRAP